MYDHITHQVGLDEIRPNKGKEIKRFMQEKNKLLANFDKLACTSCERLTYHATQYVQLGELKEEMAACDKILASESNEKEDDF